MKADAYHFWLSLVILLGGGFMAARYPDARETIFIFLATIIAFWFGTRNGNGHSNDKEAHR